MKNLRPLLIVMLCLMAACGFHPVYGTHDKSGVAVAEQLNQIAIDNIPNRSGQFLRNALIDRMYGKGRPGQPLYRLRVSIRTAEEHLGLLANATSTLSQMTSVGDFVLTDNQGKELMRATARSVSTYDLISDQYGTLAAQDSALQRNITELSEQIVNRLGLYFAEPPAPAEPATTAPQTQK